MAVSMYSELTRTSAFRGHTEHIKEHCYLHSHSNDDRIVCFFFAKNDRNTFLTEFICFIGSILRLFVDVEFHWIAPQFMQISVFTENPFRLVNNGSTFWQLGNKVFRKYSHYPTFNCLPNYLHRPACWSTSVPV